MSGGSKPGTVASICTTIPAQYPVPKLGLDSLNTCQGAPTRLEEDLDTTRDQRLEECLWSNWPAWLMNHGMHRVIWFCSVKPLGKTMVLRLLGTRESVTARTGFRMLFFSS